MTLLYDNAWRLREVTHLLLRQVDLAAGCLRLDPGQAKSTGDPRTVYLRPETLAMLRAHVERVRDLERATGRVIPYSVSVSDLPGFGDPPRARRHPARQLHAGLGGRVPSGGLPGPPRA